MFSRLRWLFILVIIGVEIYGAYFEGEDDGPQFRRPPVARDHEPTLPPPRAGTTLPKISPNDPSFAVDVGEKGNSTGTAFSIKDDGVWLTARHVVDGCDKVGLITGPRKGMRVQRIEPHPRADMAVLWTRRGGPALSISDNSLQINQAGFHFGFPQGKPGQVTSALLGRRKMRTVGRYRHSEPVIAWVERERIPMTKALGGLSGGPALNGAGEIIGATVAASMRRGRVFTTAPATLTAMLDRAQTRPAGRPSAGLSAAGPTEANFVRYGGGLRRQLTVAQVLCFVEESNSRRPRRRRH